MRVVMLEGSGRVYTSRVYLVLGDGNRLEDVNALVNAGQDPVILASIEKAPKGGGKWPVEQVVLTHSHSDHCALLPEVRAVFYPRVWAFSPNIDGAGLLRDGDDIRMRNAVFEVIHAPTQQRLHLPVQRAGRDAFRRRIAAADHLGREELRGRFQGGIGDIVRPRCKSNLPRAWAPVDRAMQPEAVRAAKIGCRNRVGQR